MNKTINRRKKNRVLPGFGLNLGYSIFYLSVIMLLPLSTIFIKSFSLTWHEFWSIISDPRVIESYKLSFGTSLIAASINTIFGFIIAWTLVRYDFFGKKFFDAIVDLPFALPTAVAGISLTAVFSSNGIIGKYLYALGIQSVFSPAGIIIALTFIGLPFVVRTVQPVLQDFDKEIEDAAASLNANRIQIFFKIILPGMKDALLTGFTLAFARALGEYGSVVFISGNMPFKTEITPLIIMTKLEQFDYKAAASIALVMLLISLFLLILINILQLKLRKDKIY